MSQNHSHYKKDVSHLKMVDVYRVLALFNVSDPGVQHAIKKLLVAGGRGDKGKMKDYQEAIDSVQRAIDMEAEDSGFVDIVNPAQQFVQAFHGNVEESGLVAGLRAEVRRLTHERDSAREVIGKCIYLRSEGERIELTEKDVNRLFIAANARLENIGLEDQKLVIPRSPRVPKPAKKAPVRRRKAGR